MLRTVAVVGVVITLLTGCAADSGPGGARATEASAAQTADTAPDPYAIGATVTPAGAVPRDAQTEQFQRGNEVYLSINVAGASTDQEISVRWVGPQGEVIREDEREVPEGSAHVAFSSGSTARWRSGQHRAVITINGRRVSEREFELL